MTEEELTLAHVTVAVAGAREVANQKDAIVLGCKMEFSHVMLPQTVIGVREAWESNGFYTWRLKDS